MMRVGVAPDSWGVWFPDDPRQPPWSRFLDEVVVAGYHAIELGPYGYLPTDPETLRAELEMRGLELSGAFVFSSFHAPGAWSNLREEVEQTCEMLSAFGAGYLILVSTLYTDLFTGELIEPPTLDDDGWKRLVDTVHQIAAYTNDREIEAVFHPHAQTPVQYEEQIEQFLADTDPTVVSLCLDVGHHAYCGGDPVSFFRQHHERIEYLHLKSVDATLQTRVEEESLSFAQAVEMGTFVELDRGAIDFVSFRDVARDVGYEGWAIVEQDMYPAQFDKPLPIARNNRAYLERIGIG